MFQELETGRLQLKNIGFDDAAFMYREFSTDEVNTYLYDAEPVSSEEEAKEWIQFYTQEEPRDQHRWIIVLKENIASFESKEKIGTCGFHCWNRERKSVEIGYDLQPAYWGKGYMSECLEAMIVFAKNEMQVKTITANIAEGNIASERLVMKYGFRKQKDTYYEEFHGKKYLHYTYLLEL